MTETGTLVLYGRAGCSHCEQLQLALDLMAMRTAIPGLTDYRYVDVDDDSILKAGSNAAKIISASPYANRRDLTSALLARNLSDGSPVRNVNCQVERHRE